MKPQKKWMVLALKNARSGMKKRAGGPFGACIVQKGKAIAVAHNTVLGSRNPVRHAEINAIHIASKKLRTHDLSDCVIYSTTEPCPMCFAAIHWARIPAVYFGTGIEDVRKRGFNELSISNLHMKKAGRSPVRVRGKFMLRACRELLEDWDLLPQKELY